ncbi:MAG: hypothetical protein QOJ64_3681 [Acidobacteriota bacterium]|jgi:hypothetical protein|nr:hypothetical protein [Acidobacteriota bacterium]
MSDNLWPVAALRRSESFSNAFSIVSLNFEDNNEMRDLLSSAEEIVK